MKALNFLAITAVAFVALTACNKDGNGITVTNENGQTISNFSISSEGGTSSDWTVKTADGSDWAVTTSGISGMTASPTSGRTNFYFCITVPENTGTARTGYVTVRGNNSSKTITVEQAGK